MRLSKHTHMILSIVKISLKEVFNQSIMETLKTIAVFSLSMCQYLLFPSEKNIQNILIIFYYRYWLTIMDPDGQQQNEIKTIDEVDPMQKALLDVNTSSSSGASTSGWFP